MGGAATSRCGTQYSRADGVLFLHLVQDLRHLRAKPSVEFLYRTHRLQRPSHSDGDGDLAAAQVLRVILVHIRCTPQMIIGKIGTAASRAIRTAPVLNSFNSKLRLMVASGYTPTNSPVRNFCTASA